MRSPVPTCRRPHPRRRRRARCQQRALTTVLGVALVVLSACERDVALLTGSEVSAAATTYPERGEVGLRPGTPLTRRAAPELVVNTAGTVLDGLDLGCVKIQASNVTIRNSRVVCRREQPAIWQTSNATGLVVEDSDVSSAGPAIATAAIYSASAIEARRNNLHHVVDGIQPGSGSLIEFNWIHDLAGDGHNDGIQLTGGTDIVIRFNRIEHRAAQTSALMIKADIAPISAVLVEGNLLAGGGFTVYVHRGAGSGGCCAAPSRVTLIDNTIVADSYIWGAMVAQGSPTLSCNRLSTGAPVVSFTETNFQGRTTTPCAI